MQIVVVVERNEYKIIPTAQKAVAGITSIIINANEKMELTVL
jgi:hypothetical protein